MGEVPARALLARLLFLLFLWVVETITPEGDPPSLRDAEERHRTSFVGPPTACHGRAPRAPAAGVCAVSSPLRPPTIPGTSCGDLARPPLAVGPPISQQGHGFHRCCMCSSRHHSKCGYLANKHLHNSPGTRFDYREVREDELRWNCNCYDLCGDGHHDEDQQLLCQCRDCQLGRCSGKQRSCLGFCLRRSILMMTLTRPPMCRFNFQIFFCIWCMPTLSTPDHCRHQFCSLKTVCRRSQTNLMTTSL